MTKGYTLDSNILRPILKQDQQVTGRLFPDELRVVLIEYVQDSDVYLVIRDGECVIRWMNVTQYLKTRSDEKSKQIVFAGERLDAGAIWRARDVYLLGRSPQQGSSAAAQKSFPV